MYTVLHTRSLEKNVFNLQLVVVKLMLFMFKNCNYSIIYFTLFSTQVPNFFYVLFIAFFLRQYLLTVFLYY